MFTSLRKAASIGLPIIGLSLLAFSAQADVLPAYNLDFTILNGTALGPGNTKEFMGTANPDGWTYVGGGGNLVFVGQGGSDTSNPNPIYAGLTAPPTGGNFVQADGNPDFESVFYERITGLTAGQTYSLSFYQAAGQQQGFTGATTEQWIVSLGTSALTSSTTGGPVDPTYGATGSYSNADPTASIVKTALMSTASQGVTPWQYVTVTLTADAATQYLSFLAWGDNGSTVNLPPMVFLSGVNQPDVLPEPATLALFAIGLLGFGASRMRRPAKHTEEV